MLLLALSLTATAAPAWADGCTITGGGDQRGLSCPTLTASVYDGQAAPLDAALNAMADGYRGGAKDVLVEVRREELDVAGAERGMLQVMRDDQSEIFVVRGVKARAAGLRLVACIVRARAQSDAVAVCAEVVPHLLENGVPEDLPAAAPTGPGVEEILGGPVAVPSGCQSRGSRDKVEVQCRDGMVVLMALPPGLTSADVTPSMLDSLAGFVQSQGGQAIARGEGACEVLGVETRCGTLSASAPGRSDFRAAVGGAKRAKGEVFVACNGVGGRLPEVCAKYLTRAPSFD